MAAEDRRVNLIFWLGVAALAAIIATAYLLTRATREPRATHRRRGR